MIEKIKAWFSELGLSKEAKCTKEFGTYCWLKEETYEELCIGCATYQFSTVNSWSDKVRHLYGDALD